MMKYVKLASVSLVIIFAVLMTPALHNITYAQQSEYKSLIANIWIGTALYLATDKTFIGTVIDINDDHIFPDGTNRRAIRVKFWDGSNSWIPRLIFDSVSRK